MSIGKNIAKFRKEKSLTQTDLGDILGVSNQAVSKWESEINMPDVMLLPQLVKALGVTFNQLYDIPDEDARVDLPWEDDGVIRGSVDFNRRGGLVCRAGLRGDRKGAYIQQGLEMLESMANQLDRRCPDTEGAPKKALYQSQVLATVASFGKEGQIPDGWKLFYAYKQLVLAACLFGCGRTEEGWQNFNHAITLCKYVYGLADEWLEIGGELFANIKVSKDWNHAIDQDGQVHKLFAIVNLSFYNAKYILDLLTNPQWAWFDTARDSHTYQEAVAWLSEVYEAQKAEL